MKNSHHCYAAGGICNRDISVLFNNGNCNDRSMVCTNKEWAGYISAIILITIDRSFESHGLIFGSYQVSSYTYKVGLNLGVNIIYPLIVMVIIFVLVNVAVRFKKKEFLGT